MRFVRLILSICVFFCAALLPVCGTSSRGSGAEHEHHPSIYRGPEFLGPIRIDRADHVISVQQVWRALGKPELRRSDSLCYRDPDSEFFLRLVRGADNPRLIREVMLSSFPNCLTRRVDQASHFSKWTTEKGIGLASPEQAVIAAYGQPTRIDDAKRDALAYLSEVEGIREKLAILPYLPHGDRVLNYLPPEGAADLRAAAIGIKNGKVTWIWLSDNE